ncbi:hypothetical protein Sjap_018341 [Stephania japonica]|uniref:Uncharacterized protein n=1 Tax=Stephania japonica TaxID=461633 RepID=A0AAP0I8K9_9MAGN
MMNEVNREEVEDKKSPEGGSCKEDELRTEKMHAFIQVPFALTWLLHAGISYMADGLETAKDEINMWFKPEELVSYTSNAEKWVYGVN